MNKYSLQDLVAMDNYLPGWDLCISDVRINKLCHSSVKQYQPEFTGKHAPIIRIKNV